MESVPIFPAFNILVDSSRNSQKFRCEFGNFSIGAHVWAIGRLAKPSIALKETSIFSIIIMSLPVRSRNNIVDSKSSKLQIYWIKNLYDALFTSVFGSEKNILANIFVVGLTLAQNLMTLSGVSKSLTVLRYFEVFVQVQTMR